VEKLFAREPGDPRSGQQGKPCWSAP
jgi:hypothetical protein